jgi:hypothetical protein
VEEYDPATDTWTKKADIPTARSWLSTRAVDGKIYAIDGWRSTNTSSVEEYDPATDTWTKKAEMPILRWELATSAVDGKIYVIGGGNRRTVQEYDPTTDTWTRKPDMPTARGRLSACAVNGKIYAIGGSNWDNATNQESILSAVEEYDPATNTWTKKADLPMPTHEHVASVVNGKIYVMGGEGALTQTPGAAQTILSTIMKYDPPTDTWTKEGDMPVPRTAMSASVVDGRIYVIGGKEVGVRGISTVEAYQPEPYPADGAELVDLNVELSWTAGLGAALHTVYFGDNLDDVNNVAGGLKQGSTTYTPGPLNPAKTYYWRVDEFGLGQGAETHKGDVWSFTTVGAVGSPNPSNGAVDVKRTPVLTWVPGVYAVSHQVYFGSDAEAMKNADTGSPEYKGSGNLGSQSYDAGQLEWNTTYYWRIDEVNYANPDSPWTGPVWCFTTANFIVVDDFESYNDLNEEEPESNRIYFAWLDGFGDPTNGSVLGYLIPPFTEHTIVHSGNQSMPFAYNNAVGNSEATMTLTYPRDWTENGVSTLSIWFASDWDWRADVSYNTAEPMYVALNDNAVVYHDNPDAALTTSWTAWNIDLTRFAEQGVNLTNVNSITLGFGDKNNPQFGSSGKMYFDDIRLYRP